MIYTNLLLFLVAIFLFSIDTVPEVPLLPGWQALAIGGLLLAGYAGIAAKLFRRPLALQSSGYFQTEKQLSVMALCFFAATLYICDPKFHFSSLPLGKTMPALVNFGGLALFVFYLVLMWRAGRKNYVRIFNREHSTPSFIRSNIKVNLPIVLPWIMLSLLYDIVALMPFAGLQQILHSEWGDFLFFGVFLVFVLIFFPPLVRRLWGCQKLPEGYLKTQLDTFCAKQNFSADFYLWPLFEGRMLTAGVMGIVPGLRYILITPGLLETMSQSELEAIMAHEIGHVKKYHMLLYVFLIAGFGLFAGMLAEPLIYMVLSLDVISWLVIKSGITVQNALAVVGAVSMLTFMLLYFRFIFGFFIRNFERQADLFSLEAIGDCRAMVSAFEKISILSGDIRDQRNWHHFGIGERIDCLEGAEREPGRIVRHNRKVWSSLLVYVVVASVSIFLVHQIPMETLTQRYQENLVEAVLLEKVKQEPDNAMWQRFLGDLMLTKKMEKEGLSAYEKAYSIDPVSPEIMNNIAWVLLTSEDLGLRDPARALTLARAAAVLMPKGYVLDTLATAFWANDLIDQAVRTEKQAAQEDEAQKELYQMRMAKFSSQKYEDSVREIEIKQNFKNIN